MFLLLTSFYP